jgi:hypothetical protein
MPATVSSHSERLLVAREIICAECGRSFLPHRVGDGAELLCNACYDAQFRLALPALPEEPLTRDDLYPVPAAHE